MSPREGRTPGRGVLAAVALAALVLLGAGVWLRPPTSSPSPAADAAPGPEGTPAARRTAVRSPLDPADQPAAVPGPTSAGSTPSGSALSGAAGAPGAPAAPASGPGTDQRLPTAPPADVSWQLWNGLALPFSRSAGPVTVQGDVVAGFARTPTGALLAAVHAVGRRAAATDPGWRAVAANLLAPGAGRDAWVAARARVQLATPPPPGTFAQLAGFQFVSWTLTDAALQLATRNPGGDFGVVTVHVTWLDGDWRLVLAPDGGDASSKQRAPSLAGFIAWGGV